MMMIKICVALLLSLYSVCVHGNDAPVIGILGLPTSEGCITMDSPKRMESYRNMVGTKKYDGVSCFDSFYVKWLEQGGAQVVPLHHNMSSSEIQSMYTQLNGILYTGGELDLTLESPYVQTAKQFYDLATKDKSDVFAIWGTCMGFQLLNIIQAWNTSVLCSGCFKGVDNTPLPITLTPNGGKSRFISALPPPVVYSLTHESITQNFHVSGVTPDVFNSNPHLHTFFDAISTNVDANNKEFISTMEAKEWPIYATQWHPERPEFEFEPYDTINHSIAADVAMQAAADFFVEQARASNHKFKSVADQQGALIYNYATINHGFGTELYVY